MDSFFNYMNVFRLVLKWKYHLLILAGAALILSAVFTSKIFIKPLYRSYAVLYPSNIFPYSDESETEQMIQLMNSSSIRDSVINKFELGKHWGLNPKEKYYKSTLLYLYGKRVGIKKTEYESVIIDVLDTDPKIACDIVNSVISYYDQKVHSLQKQKFHEVVINYRIVLEKKQQSLDSIQQAIDALINDKGLPPARVPDPALIRSYAEKMNESTASGKDKKNNSLDVVKRMRSNPGTKESQLVLLTSLAMSEAEAYSEFKLKYDEALLNDNRKYTYSNIVATPFVSDKKASPKTWLIITFSVLATFFLSLTVISFIENRRLKTSPAGTSDI